MSNQYPSNHNSYHDPRARLGDLAQYIQAPVEQQQTHLPKMIAVSTVGKQEMPGQRCHLPVDIVKTPALGVAESKRTGTRQELAAIVDAGGDQLFGVIRHMGRNGGMRMFLTAFSREPQGRGKIVSELYCAGEPVKVGRRAEPSYPGTVSGNHFEIELADSGEMQVHDLDSTNDTTLMTAMKPGLKIPFDLRWAPEASSLEAHRQPFIPKNVGATAMSGAVSFAPPPGPAHEMLR